MSQSALGERLIALRRDLHRYPELSFEEHESSERLADALAALGIADVQRITQTGVVARVRGTDAAAPVVALRGDIDALPITEATGLPFASERAGVMHACGHDVHASWTVGAAALLHETPPLGDVLIVLQPAEEVGLGAAQVLASGALADARMIFGAHVDRRFTVGQVVAQAGPLAASADVFAIELRGKGAHGARPHEAHDPIVCLAAIVTALQTIVSRRVNPATPAVVSVGTINSGTAANVIPERARLTGTLRATDPATRALLQQEVRDIATSIAHAHRVEADVSFSSGVPPVVNDARAAGIAAAAAASTVGEQNVVPLGITNMAAEDFAFYLERMPGCFLRIGARREGEPVIAAHSSHFDVAEEAIMVGARVLAECARRASAALAQERT